jgi:peptidoglycan/xylan/chitin deacetylase (PgdA/CDA1 family)
MILLVGCTSTSIVRSSPANSAITIIVDGTSRQVATGTTLGAALRLFSLRPKPGRLLSVTGDVLKRNVDEGNVLLNGSRADHHTELSGGDSIRILDGKDRMEPVRRDRTMLSGFHFGDPQFSLNRWRLERIVTTGKDSGEVASVDYRPVGKPHVDRDVALTFDDGPWPRFTRKILDILRHRHVPATFFMIGRNIDRWPAIARDVVRAGMVVGNHSWDHPNELAFSELKPVRLRWELSRTNDALRSVGIDDPYLLRPPGGSYDEEVLQEARRQGLRVVNWNVDPHDWEAGRSPKEIARAVLSSVGPGSIVDLHDGGGNRTATVRALPAIIKGLRKRHLQLVAIGR